MNKKTLYLLGILLTLILGSFLNWKFCCSCLCSNKDTENKKSQDQSNISKTTKSASILPFIINDADGNLSIKIDDNFNFKISSADFLKPITSNLSAELVKLKDYLITNNGKLLSITGYYTSNETNNSIYPNLGLARANSVKNHLISLGIPSNIIDTYGEQKDDLVANDKGYFNGATKFGLANAKDNSEALKVLGDEIKASPLVLYFKTGQASTNLTGKQRQKIAKISRYLDKVNGAKSVIIGHADIIGTPEKNMILGQERANFVKNYFVKNGVSESKIEAKSKGFNEPIADNTTEEGRAKNRRTVVTIQ